MQILHTAQKAREFVISLRKQDQSFGFVPTMGALHAGHMSLIKQARKDNAIILCSVYVNPTQFNKAEDLEKYPRNLKRDIRVLEAAGCDALFGPSDADMYPGGKRESLSMAFGPMDKVLEGQFRPGHFSGVGLVLAKLFNILKPDRVYLGQKDLQQCSVVNKLVTDLCFDTELVVVPTVREPNGLAMSSRNERLSAEGRQRGASLYAALQTVKAAILGGDTVHKARQKGLDLLASYPQVEVEYLEVVDRTRFVVLKGTDVAGQMAVCAAAYVEGVRLIDNVVLNS